MKKTFASFTGSALPILAAIIALSWGSTVFADPTPVVEVFHSSPSYLNDDGTVILSWTAGATTGDDLYFACPMGVTVALNGTSFPCNTIQTYSSNPSDSGSFVVTNVSGERQNVTVTAYPVDSSGAAYDPGALSTTFVVGTSPDPITSFSLSGASVTSGMPVIITWSASDTPGVNFEFDCNPNIEIAAAATSTQGLPCGAAAFSPDLGQSGTTTVIAQNLSASPATIMVHAVPLIAPGSYDLTHSLTASLTVNPVSAGTQPTATGFTSSSPSVTSGVPFALTWTTSNAAGANIEFICNGYAFTSRDRFGNDDDAGIMQYASFLLCARRGRQHYRRDLGQRLADEPVLGRTPSRRIEWHLLCLRRSLARTFDRRGRFASGDRQFSDYHYSSAPVGVGPYGQQLCNILAALHLYPRASARIG